MAYRGYQSTAPMERLDPVILPFGLPRPVLRATLAGAVFVAPASALAADYYVDPGGDDQNDGSEGAPLATIQEAADRVAPGDQVLVGAGEYDAFQVRTDGTQKAPIVFTATRADVIVSGTAQCGNRPCTIYVEADYITIDGFDVRPNGELDARECGIRLSNGGGNVNPEKLGDVVRNCTVTGAGWVGISASRVENLLLEYNEVSGSVEQHGIYFANSSDNPTIRFNSLHHNNESGVQINADPAISGDGISTGAVVAFNTIYENGLGGAGGGSAINLASVRDAYFVGNLLYNNHAGGVSNWDDGCNDQSFNDGPCNVPMGTWGCKDNTYLFNTVVQAADGRKAFTLRAGSTGATLANNILLHSGQAAGFGVDSGSLEGLSSDYNVMVTVEDTTGNPVPLAQWVMSEGQDLNSISAVAADLFVGAQDFHLAEGAAAIDAGNDLTDLLAFELFDIDGDARPAGRTYDIGADEFGSSPADGGTGDGGGSEDGGSGTDGADGGSGGGGGGDGADDGGSGADGGEGGETGNAGSETGNGSAADGSEGGCACASSGQRSTPAGWLGSFLLLLLGLGLGRVFRRP